MILLTDKLVDVDSPSVELTKSNLPVLVTSFNRPNLLKSVVEATFEAGCRNVYFASDGPRNSLDIETINQSLAIFRKKFSWVPSENMLIRNVNVGCRQAMYENICWFFDRVRFGVVLEDDCVPSESFFRFMIEGLSTFREDKRVFSISGYCPEQVQSPHRYRKSIYPLVWGWGSWSDRIEKYSLDFDDYQSVIKSGQKLLLNRTWRVAGKYKWLMLMKLAGTGSIDTWDYSFTASTWRENSYSVSTTVNLIKNIGFGSGATHTTKEPPEWASKDFVDNLPLNFQMDNLEYTSLDSQHDKRIEDLVFALNFRGLVALIILRSRNYCIEFLKSNFRFRSRNRINIE